MPVARAQALNHVLVTLCEDGPADTYDGNIRASLANAGIASVQDIVTISHDDLRLLQHGRSPADNALVELSLGGRGMITAIVCMNMNENSTNGNGLTLDGWVDVTKEQFDQFRISNEFTMHRNIYDDPGTVRPITPRSLGGTNGTSNRDKVYDHKRAIKRDQSVF